MATYRALLEQGRTKLEATSKTPRLDSELLLCFAAEMTRAKLWTCLDQEVAGETAESFYKSVLQRSTHEPLAYIIGIKEFWGLNFQVDRNVLVPRPETELLVECGMKFLQAKEPPFSILDLGTGSGCVAVSLAVELEKLKVPYSILATDISKTALEVAAGNIEELRLQLHIKLLKSDWFAEIDPQQHQFDLILSNPPYIAEGDSNTSPELLFEPRIALYSGSDGLTALRHLIESAAEFLKPAGAFFSEIGFEQRQALTEIFEELRKDQTFEFATLEFHRDLAGRDRVMKLALSGAK